MRFRNFSSGQSIIELLVALSLLVVISVTVIGLVGLSSRLLFESERKVVALGLLTDQLEFYRSQLFDDVGDGLNGIVERNYRQGVAGQEFDVTATISELNGPPFAGTREDVKEVQVEVEWTVPGGEIKKIQGTTYISDRPPAKECGPCAVGKTCDPTLGICTRVAPSFIWHSDCAVGELCPNGGICPLNRECEPLSSPPPDPPDSDARNCKPGSICSNNAVCPFSGQCPEVRCADGCESQEQCFQGWCYNNEWYGYDQWSPPDSSGPAYISGDPDNPTTMMCESDVAGCDTSADCPTSCVDGDNAILWRCESGWVPQCLAAIGGGASDLCQGTLDPPSGNCVGPKAIRPEPCPTPDPFVDPNRSWCQNLDECGLSSSNSLCTYDDDCERGEMCGSGNCRTICPDTSEASPLYGGYAKSCQATVIKGFHNPQTDPETGVATSLGSCFNTTSGGSLPTIDVDLRFQDTADEVVFEGTAGTTAIPVVVGLSEGADDTVTVLVTIDKISASFDNSSDLSGMVPAFQDNSRHVFTFEPGDPIEQLFTIQINTDSSPEIHEDFQIEVTVATSNVVGLDLPDPLAVKILNDDFRFDVLNAPTMVEGTDADENDAQFPVRRTGAVAPGVTVTAFLSTADGTALIADDDYVAQSDTPVSFGPSDTLTEDQPFAVDLIADSVPEHDENFTASISSVDPASATIGSFGSASIDNDDILVHLSKGSTWNYNSSPEFEGDVAGDDRGVRFYLILPYGASPTGPIQAHVRTVNGSALAGSDFNAIDQVYTINQGVTKMDVHVFVIEDTTVESLNEDFKVELVSVTGNGGIRGNFEATGEIIDDDDGIERIIVTDAGVVEGEWAGFVAKVARNSIVPVVTVDYETSDGSATLADSDYTSSAGTMSFEFSRRQIMWANTLSDTNVEPNENFTLDLSGSVNATIYGTTGIGTIYTDD